MLTTVLREWVSFGLNDMPLVVMEEMHLPSHFLIVSFPESPFFKIPVNEVNYDLHFVQCLHSLQPDVNVPSQFSIVNFLALYFFFCSPAVHLALSEARGFPFPV
jgi:hypothetical protein